MEASSPARMARACLALEGLSVGDAFGELFFDRTLSAALTQGEPPALPAGPWPWTDDTAMALGIVEILDRYGEIDPVALSSIFARNYAAEPHRGYGAMARRILTALYAGKDGVALARSAFGGQGSMGNGGAMRVAPVGAYFADDENAAIENARRSAAVTHTHPEGQAGAIAVALATRAAAWGGNPLAGALSGAPEGQTRSGLLAAAELPLATPVARAVDALGNGSRVTAPDTVPFALWCATRHSGDYPATLWATVAGGGDRDTTGAIAGGVAALAAGMDGIPAPWREAREPLPLTG